MSLWFATSSLSYILKPSGYPENLPCAQHCVRCGWRDTERKRDGPSLGEVQRQTLEIWWIHRKQPLPLLAGPQRIPQRRHTQARPWSMWPCMICPLLNQRFGLAFYFLNFPDLDPPKNFCTWSSLCLECSSLLLSQNCFLLTIPSSTRPSLSTLSKGSFPPQPSNSLSHHQALFSSCPLVWSEIISINYLLTRRLCAFPQSEEEQGICLSCHYCIPASWHGVWHIMGAQYLLNYSWKVWEIRLSLFPARCILQSPSLKHRALPAQDDGFSPERAPLREIASLAECKHHPGPTTEQIVFDSMWHLEAK